MSSCKGDAECPLAKTGNIVLDSERQLREDPMVIWFCIIQVR